MPDKAKIAVVNFEMTEQEVLAKPEAFQAALVQLFNHWVRGGEFVPATIEFRKSTGQNHLGITRQMTSLVMRALPNG